MGCNLLHRNVLTSHHQQSTRQAPGSGAFPVNFRTAQQRRETLLRVTDDLAPPNGIVGTPDGSRVYIADQGAGRLWTYRPESDGTTLFITARRSLYRVEMLVTGQ